MKSRIVIVGHRGVGKTTLLQRMASYRAFASYAFFDLDSEIEKNQGTSVSEIFTRFGEPHFRRLEQEIFQILMVSKPKLVLSVGGGFQFPSTENDLAELKTRLDLHILWLKRTTDQTGRIFLDRPRLNQIVGPLQEYKERFGIREPRFAEIADQVHWVPEGLDCQGNNFEERLLSAPGASQAAEKTTQEFYSDFGLPQLCLTTLQPNFHEQALSNPYHFEVRDDLLNADEIAKALGKRIKDCLVSFRKKDLWQSTLALVADHMAKSSHPPLGLDWPLEWGVPPDKVLLSQNRVVCSYHGLPNESVTKSLKVATDLFSQTVCRPQFATGRPPLLKVALAVENFDDLKLGYLWQKDSPTSRSFLPMSNSGKFKWFRQLSMRTMPLGFFKLHQGTAADQPTIYETIDWPRPPYKAEFAAVIGSPVLHSRTPTEHRNFFANLGIPVVAIDIPASEFTEETLNWLRELGLCFAAVTAPLKEKAFLIAQNIIEPARSLKSVNTLIVTSNKAWNGGNTDLAGFAKLVSDIRPSDPTVIWGGGGTLAMMKAVLPFAASYSAQTGSPRPGEASISAPKFLIWAVGRDTFELNPTWPDFDNNSPKIIIDLNYAEDSPGREYAQKTGAKYISGLAMFKVQADEQRKLFTSIRSNL